MPRKPSNTCRGGSGTALRRAHRDAPLQEIGDAFRRAHAYKPDGTPGEWPSCPRCFDGKDVRPGYKPPEFHQDVRTYRCHACRFDFSDLIGTPIERTQAPLVQWAWLLMMPPDDKSIIGRRGGRHSVRNERLREQRQRIHGSPFGLRWKAELEKAGITLDQLTAAQATAPKRKAKR